MSPDRPTFSPVWHRVRAMKPRPRPHVQITRQHYRGRRWHVVHDPASNNFYRLSPIAHEFVCLLDGRRTVEEVWNLSLARHADAAPTQQEVIELLSQMYNSNLLAVDATPETEQLLRRGRERIKKRIQQQAIGIMYFRVRLFNPDAILTWLEPLLRPVLNRWGLLLWASFVIFALARVLPRFDELRAAFGAAIAPENWFWLMVVFIVTKAIHEVGHGVICKRSGGQVPELGAMLLVLIPAPYVDASACWAFPSKWRRIAVGAGGMIFELFVASIAALVWLGTAPGQLVNQLAYNAMFMASISTLLFNANPLMRFDGYYILSDLLEVPNLMQRSMKMLQHLAQKHIYRVERTTPPSTSRSERTILLVYGVCALAYRIFLFFAITLYVMGKLFAIGLILAVWTASVWFFLPVGKFAHWLATGPQLAEFRARAVLTSLGLLLLAGILLGVVPFPDNRRGAGVVESVNRSGVFFAADGFVVEALARLGDSVVEGQPIVRCDSPDLRARLLGAQAELAELESREREMTARDPAAATIARERIAVQRELIDRISERTEALTVRAPHDGIIVAGLRGADPGDVVGAYAKRGQQLCELVDPANIRIAASLTTAQAAPLIELGQENYRVELRLLSSPERVFRGSGVRVVEAGRRTLPHAGVGYSGGGAVEIDDQERSGLLAKRPVFTVYIDEFRPAAGDAPAWMGAPGERVRLRFTLPRRPLLGQWVDRLHKLIQGRVDV